MASSRVNYGETRHTPLWAMSVADRDAFRRIGDEYTVAKTCGHAQCTLTQQLCCACLDARDSRTQYRRYVDGKGFLACGKRWDYYCPTCKDLLWVPETRSAVSDDTIPVNEWRRRAQVPAFGTPEEIADDNYVSPITSMHQRMLHPRQDTRSSTAADLTPSQSNALIRYQAPLSLPNRPPPIAPIDLRISDECKVCFSQHCDTLVLPCAHLVMCRYCADVIVPAVVGRRIGKCPLCRQFVNRKVLQKVIIQKRSNF